MTTVRNAESGDIPYIAAIERESFPDPWTENGLAEELSQQVIFTCAVDESGECCGYLIGSANGDFASVDKIACHSAHRRQGIGRKLLEDFFRRAEENGCGSASLEVRESNIGAAALYMSVGFRKAGVRRRFYSSPTENGLVFIKEL